MNDKVVCLRTVILCLLVNAWIAAAPRAMADDFSSYHLAAPFHLPGSANLNTRGPAVMDALPDGRLLVVSTAVTSQAASFGTPEVYVETAPDSRQWTSLGTLPTAAGVQWPTYGGSFLKVSPDGTKVAIGDNSGDVGVVSTVSLLTQTARISWFSASNFDAAWSSDNSHLAISGTTSSFAPIVTYLDTSSSVTNPSNPTLITNIGGASAGITFDSAGNLYTGNGYGATAGLIRKFSATKWQGAATGSPLDFMSNTDGATVTTLLAADSLQFDRSGNLLVGGADLFSGNPNPSENFFGVVQNPANGSGLLKFDPDGTADSSYYLIYDKATGEIFANEQFGNNGDPTLVYDISAVPEPSTLVLASLGGLGMVFVARRRRVA